jgi:hypothetical protein
MRGGLGMVDVSTSMLFGGISGSAVADTSATGTILIPAMKAKGYGVDYAVSLTVTSSIAGILIPPSHNMIIYSLSAGGNLSVADLFTGVGVNGVRRAYVPVLDFTNPAAPVGTGVCMICVNSRGDMGEVDDVRDVLEVGKGWIEECVAKDLARRAEPPKRVKPKPATLTRADFSKVPKAHIPILTGKRSKAKDTGAIARTADWSPIQPK